MVRSVYPQRALKSPSARIGHVKRRLKLPDGLSHVSQGKHHQALLVNKTDAAHNGRMSEQLQYLHLKSMKVVA